MMLKIIFQSIRRVSWKSGFLFSFTLPLLIACSPDVNDSTPDIIIGEIVSVTVSIVETSPNQLQITAQGITSSAGWSGPYLIQNETLVPPADGIYDFSFYASPPIENSSSVLTSINVSHRLTTVPSDLKGVRVYSTSNNITAMLDQQKPALATIINEISNVQLSLLKTLPPKLQIDVLGNVDMPGWQRSTLVPSEYLLPPADGIYDFTYYAYPPEISGKTILTTINVTDIVDPIPATLKGVRIVSQSNSMEALFDTVSILPTPQLVNEIIDLNVALVASATPYAEINVSGTVTTRGWLKPVLVPTKYVQPPQNGVYEFSFYATPPIADSGMAISPIEVKHIFNISPDKIKGVRILSATNELQTRVGGTLAIATVAEKISEITGVTLMTSATIGPGKIDLIVEGIVVSAGWTEPTLIPFQYLVPPQDGVYDYTFYARPPAEPSAAVLTPISVRHRLQMPANFTGARIHSNSNKILELLP